MMGDEVITLLELRCPGLNRRGVQDQSSVGGLALGY